MLGRIHSFQSLGTLDGPGVRFVVFMQGCNLRCGCCHNPDTWDIMGGTEYLPSDVFRKVLRFKEYFGKDGGITVSGGEPLIQASFVREFFELCKENNINTCLDTSGGILNDEVKALLRVTDRVLLDIKYTDDAKYRKYVGCEFSKPLKFLDYLNEIGTPVTMRQVIIPSINDDLDNVKKLNCIAEQHKCVDKVELLQFKKLCQSKYDNLGIKFRFSHISEPSKHKMVMLESYINIKYR